MTNDEIIKQLQDIKCHCREMYEAEIKNEDTSPSIWGKDVEALDMAIKALGQQPVIDKIRAEIDSALSEELPNDIRTQISDVGIGLEIALKIIDKHRKEEE